MRVQCRLCIYGHLLIESNKVILPVKFFYGIVLPHGKAANYWKVTGK